MSEVHVFQEPQRRFAWDGTISLNTLAVCCTILGALYGVTEKIADARAVVAVHAAEIEILKQQRVIDRAELLAELATINRKLDDLQLQRTRR